MRTFTIQDGLIPSVTAKNLGPNFPKDEIKSVVSDVNSNLPKLTNGTGVSIKATNPTTPS